MLPEVSWSTPTMSRYNWPWDKQGGNDGDLSYILSSFESHAGGEHCANECARSWERSGSRDFCGRKQKKQCVWKVCSTLVMPLIESFRHSSIGRGPGGFDRKFSEFSSSRVSQTSTGATTARLLIEHLTFLFGKVTFLRVQSATMRDLEEDDSVESLKAKNQKVSKSLPIREEDTCCARCLRCWVRSRRSRRRRKSSVDLHGTWGRPWLSPSSNRCCRGSREGGWRSWWQSFGNVYSIFHLSSFAHLSLSGPNTLEIVFPKVKWWRMYKGKLVFLCKPRIH